MNKWNMLVVNEKLSQSMCLAPTPEKIEEYELYKKHFNELYEEMENWKKECKQKENIIKEVRNWVNSTIDIIKQQPTGNDEWILERLNSFISLLDKGE